MVVKAEAVLEGNTYELARDNQTGCYTASIQAPKQYHWSDEKYSYYPVLVRVTDDAGNVTVRTVSDAAVGKDLLLVVREEQLFPLKYIAANAEGEELGYIREAHLLDLDLGDSNDFELQLDASSWNKEWYNWRHRVYIPNTEYGGLLEEQETSTKENTVTWRGDTWRGLLAQKIIQPPKDQEHLIVSGDANDVIRSVIGDRFGTLFFVEEEKSGIRISSYPFDRYCTILAGLEKMLAMQNARLKISYHQGDPGRLNGGVCLCAVPVIDWSDRLEYSQDGKLSFTALESRRGTNHLICAGEGEGTDRTVLHLYVQKDGSIGKRPYYTGLWEREALYSYTSVQSTEELEKEGMKRLQELMNKKEMNATLDDIDVDIGDIVGGRDRITGMELRKPVAGKILRTKDGKTTIEYRLKGEK